MSEETTPADVPEAEVVEGPQANTPIDASAVMAVLYQKARSDKELRLQIEAASWQVAYEGK